MDDVRSKVNANYIVNELISYKKALDMLHNEVAYLNSPNWDNKNESEMFSSANYDHAIEKVNDMVKLYNLLCLNEQLSLDFNDDTDQWELILE